MKVNFAAELQALGRMTAGELRERYREVFGEETRSGNRDFLRKRIAWRIQALAEGGLTERARRRAEELARDADPRVRPSRSDTTTAGSRAGRWSGPRSSGSLPMSMPGRSIASSSTGSIA